MAVMFSEAKVTEFYCLKDDFCEEFVGHYKIMGVETVNMESENRTFWSEILKIAVAVLTVWLPLWVFRLVVIRRRHPNGYPLNVFVAFFQ